MATMGRGRRVEIENFKNFEGEQVNHFPPHAAAVIGQNGSGACLVFALRALMASRVLTRPAQENRI